MLFTGSSEDHVLLISAHHISADGWSNRMLMKELGALYDAHAAGLPPSLPAFGRPAEFSRWQAEMLAGPEGERLWSFWRKQFAGEPPRLNLPADRPRKPVFGTSAHHGWVCESTGRNTCEARGSLESRVVSADLPLIREGWQITWGAPTD